MPNLKLDFLVINTFDVLTLGVQDISVYPTAPPNVNSPTINITLPGTIVPVSLPFAVETFNVFNSTTLGLTTVGNETDLPDGVYFIKYTVTPAFDNYVEKNIMRTDKIQEKFDNAFMKLDMMQCDLAIKTQSKVTLNSIWYMIQGSIAAANNSAIVTANKLYQQADIMLDNFITNNCGCSGNNYVVNFR
jgi:hypothetical protein